MVIAICSGFGLICLIVFFDFFQVFETNLSTALVLAGAILILCTGLYDDVQDLEFRRKLFFQAIAAYLLILAGYRIDSESLSFLPSISIMEGFLTNLLSLLWIVGIINGINLIDGLDGLAAGVSLIAFACLSFIFFTHGDIGLTILSLLIAGSLSAFLVFNFYPASILMGDSGSLFLGYILSVFVLSLQDVTHSEPFDAIITPIILLGFPIFDTGLSIVRRLFARRSPFAPDKDHIHHRLALIFSERRAVLILYGIATWLGLLALSESFLSLPVRIVLILVTLSFAVTCLHYLGYYKSQSNDEA